MHNHRRAFLMRGAAMGGALAFSHATQTFALTDDVDLLGTKGFFPIIQLATDKTTAQFCVLNESDREYSYKCVVGDKNLPVVLQRRIIKSHSRSALDKIKVEGLEPGLTYTLQVFENHLSHPIDERYFQALDTDKKQVRIAVASCMSDVHFLAETPMWKSLVAEKPDVIFLAGDNVYADILHTGGEKGFWSRYVTTRKTLWIFRSKNLIPMFCTWDDHDYGKNNGNEKFKEKEVTKDIFKAFFDPEEAIENFQFNTGVSKAWNAFGQNFIFFDDRTHRSPSLTGSHWGEEQEYFAFDFMNQYQNPSWLINGSQFFGGYHGPESFEYDHNDYLKHILNKISQQNQPVAFISGDVHYSEIMNIEPSILGYQTYEFTSSSIHSNREDFKDFKNPRRLKASSEFNFFIFDINVETQFMISIKCIGKAQKKYFSSDFLVSR